jgi:uncharacterized protein (TIGR04255 family)
MYEEVCYGKSFLKQVVVRIDFAAPLDKLDKGPPTRLVTPIALNFPIIEPKEVVTQEVAVHKDGIDHRHVTERHWNYFSKDRGRRLTLSSTAAFIQYTKYTTYEEMKDHFGGLVDALRAVFPGTIVARFGLRYINQIDEPIGDATRWNDLINDDLVAARSFFERDEQLIRHVSISELKYGQVGIRFQYGMPNPDHPAPIKRPLFVIDIDASVAEAHELNQTTAFMDEAHARIQALFERSIKKKLREKMDVQQPVQQ